MHKLNILFIAGFPINPEKGGVQRVTDLLAREFERRGFKALYLSLRGYSEKKASGNKRQYFLPNPDAFHSDENVRFTNELLRKEKIDAIINQAGIYGPVLKFNKLIDRNNAKLYTVHHNCVACLNHRYRDIVMANRGSSKLWRIFDRPVVWLLLRKMNRVKYGRYFLKAISISDRLVLLSEQFIPELKYYGVPNSKVAKVLAIPNPASFTAKYEAIQEKENRILFVGRLSVNQKRVDRLLRIWEVLHQRLPNWHFDVVGDGGDREYMESFVEQNGLSRVKFHGYTNPEPYYRKAKFFTMTSDFEGFSMVLLEAEAYGAVPIAFRCFSGMEDIVPNDVGVVVNDFNEDLYIDAIFRLVDEEGRRSKMALQGMKHVEWYQPEMIAEKWIDLFLKRIN